MRPDQLIRVIGLPLTLRRSIPILIAVTFASLCVWTWDTWPDAVTDFGRELYVPWRLFEGDLLYRDVAYFNGPLSPYFNALLFRLVGVSVHALFYANLVLLSVVCVVLYRLLQAIGDELSALLAMLVFLGVFAFGQQVGIGNYNFVAPYSHEATHGLLLAVCALAALGRACVCQRLVWVIVAGVCVGLSLLTKLEMALAAVSSSCACLACMQQQCALARLSDRSWLLYCGAVSLPPSAASLFVPWPDAFSALLAPFRNSAAQSLPLSAFYRHGMGIDEPFKNGTLLLVCAVVWMLTLAPAVILAMQMPARGVGWFCFAIAAVYALILVVARDLIPWPQFARPLPLGCALVLLHSLRRHRSRGLRGALGVGFAVLSLVLLAKMFLNARVRHYGFVLAAPGLLLMITVIASWLPEALDARGAQGAVLRAVSCALCAVLIFVHLERTARFIDQKQFAIGRGSDSFLADVRAVPLSAALDTLVATPENSTFAVFPEGAMLNFLARRRNPTPYVTFMPPEFSLFGEATMLASFTAHPPQRIVLLQKDTSEYGYASFGRDYAADWSRWIEANYRAGPLFGDKPLHEGERFDVRILVATHRPQ